jgi:hypothetical protein
MVIAGGFPPVKLALNDGIVSVGEKSVLA